MGWSLCQGGNGGGGNSKIPCICSDGRQYITLPVYGDEDLVVKFKLLRGNHESTSAVICGGWGTYKFLFHTYGYEYYYYTGTNSSVRIPEKPYVWQDCELGLGYAIVDGTTYTGGSDTRDHDALTVFGNGNNYLSNVAIGEIEIYKDGVLYLDLIPMQDSQTGEGYYHDNVGNQDYYSETSTPLIYSEL